VAIPPNRINPQTQQGKLAMGPKRNGAMPTPKYTYPDPLLSDLVQYAVTKGITMAGVEKNTYIHAPFTAKPFPYPSANFQRAVYLAPLFNNLMGKIASNSDWLLDTLSETIKEDGFTARLVDIYQHVLQEGVKQRCVLGIFRSDYMMHTLDNRSLLQVEFNTIAASFGTLSTGIADLHRFFYPNTGVPQNAAMTEIAGGIAAAHNEYLNQHGSDKVSNPIVIMVVQPNERNFADQRGIHFELWQNHRIRCIRASLKELSRYSFLSDDGVLIYKPLGGTALKDLTDVVRARIPFLVLSIITFSFFIHSCW
jgi:glutathione synthase